MRMPLRRVPVQIVDPQGAVVWSGRMTLRQWEKWRRSCREMLHAAAEMRAAAAAVQAAIGANPASCVTTVLQAAGAPVEKAR